LTQQYRRTTTSPVDRAFRTMSKSHWCLPCSHWWKNMHMYEKEKQFMSICSNRRCKTARFKSVSNDLWLANESNKIF